LPAPSPSRCSLSPPAARSPACGRSASRAVGLGGLTGGYLGARLQPPIPDRGLTLLLGILAIALSITYIIEASIG
jgi:uncharacterized membrane protein YfcA